MYKSLLFLTVSCALLCMGVWYGAAFLRNLPWRSTPGHLKPFGCCRQRTPVPVVDDWPKARQFFTDHVFKLRPVLIRNGAKVSPAYYKWTDEYFLNELQVPPSSVVLIETGKKEVRSNPAIQMNFKDWVRVYNDSDNYMVQDIPSYLGKDVVYPPSLQCPYLGNILVTGIMWFSSGGTRSVVHTDSADNINCVYRGEKEILLVDPSLHGNKVPIDVPEGAYSTIDVDSVDYSQFPGLAETDFYYARMQPGDCVYIPYLWIHQVNSFGSNLAVNIWWDHEKSLDTDLSACPDEYDANLTMDKLNFPGFESSPYDAQDTSEHFVDKIARNAEAITFEEFVNEFVEDVDEFIGVAGVGFMEPLSAMFAVMDSDADGILRQEELRTSDKKKRAAIDAYFRQFLALRTAVEDEAIRDDTPAARGDEL